MGDSAWRGKVAVGVSFVVVFGGGNTAVVKRGG